LGKILREIKDRKKHLINFKITDHERLRIEAMAKSFSNGNISAWIRFASLNYIPKKGELVEKE
jgi:hypothetical protein